MVRQCPWRLVLQVKLKSLPAGVAHFNHLEGAVMPLGVALSTLRFAGMVGVARAPPRRKEALARVLLETSRRKCHISQRA